MRNPPRGSGGISVTAGQVVTASLDRPADETRERPYCRVVRAYCEALGWLRREPRCPATVCCRHYWGDADE